MEAVGGHKMARSFSEDLRARFVQAVAEGAAARAAGRRFAIAPTTAIRWARVWRETGAQRARPRGRPTGAGKLAAHEGFLLDLYQEQGDITLHEMAARLAEQREVAVNPASLWRFLAERGITWKKRPRLRPSSTRRA
jgi:transposase